MNWEVVGVMGEWVGSLAVVVTLFYLARQIHQQNINTSLQMQDSIIEGFNQANHLLASSKELSSLFIRGLWKPEALDDGEASQFQWIFRLYVNQYLKIYRLHQQGQLSDDDWLGHSAQGAYFMSTPGGKAFCKLHGDAFKEFFDSLTESRSDNAGIDVTFGRGPGRFI